MSGRKVRVLQPKKEMRKSEVVSHGVKVVTTTEVTLVEDEQDQFEQEMSDLADQLDKVVSIERCQRLVWDAKLKDWRLCRNTEPKVGWYNGPGLSGPGGQGLIIGGLDVRLCKRHFDEFSMAMTDKDHDKVKGFRYSVA